MRNVILSHKSALEYWRLVRRACLPRRRLDDWRDDMSFGITALDEGRLDIAHGGLLPKGEAGASVLGGSEARWVLANSAIPGPTSFGALVENVPLLQHMKLPLDVLVDTATKVHKSARIAAHACTRELRENMLVSIADGIYVCSPELVFAQVAPKLSRARLVLLGLEMCGGYALAGDLPRGFEDCWNITTAPRLQSFLENTLAVGKGSRTLTAARRVADGSASPAESSLFVELTFPRKEGGCGLPVPELNGKIVPGDEAPSWFALKSYYCDLLWRDARFGIEYEGASGHTGQEAVVRDTQRANDLMQLGYTIAPVVASTMNTYEGARQIEEIARRTMRLRAPVNPKAYTELRRNLHSELR